MKVERIIRSSLPVALMVLAACGTAQAAYTNVVMGNSPIAYWGLNETNGSTAVDSSGNGHNATYSGSPTLGVPGIPAGVMGSNKAVQFDGIDDTAAAPSAAAFTPAPSGWSANQGFSVEAWIKATNGIPGNGIIVRWKPGTDAYVMYLLDDGTPFGFVRDDASISASLTGPPVTNNVFHQLVLTFGHDALNNPFQKFYVDGTLAASASAALGTMSGNSGIDMSVSAGQPFKGVMDEVSIYGTALSGGSVMNHYLAGIDIPEPSALVLVGLSGFWLIRRRRTS